MRVEGCVGTILRDTGHTPASLLVEPVEESTSLAPETEFLPCGDPRRRDMVSSPGSVHLSVPFVRSPRSDASDLGENRGLRTPRDGPGR